MYYTDILPETIEASETRVDDKQYTYIKCEFKHLWEAIKSFEEGVELYVCGKDDNPNDMECAPSGLLVRDVNKLIRNDIDIYTREETPWYKQISEEKPVYCLSVNRCLFKLTGAITKNGAIRYKPLTQEQVRDIVDTMEKWNGHNNILP